MTHAYAALAGPAPDGAARTGAAPPRAPALLDAWAARSCPVKTQHRFDPQRSAGRRARRARRPAGAPGRGRPPARGRRARAAHRPVHRSRGRPAAARRRRPRGPGRRHPVGARRRRRRRGRRRPAARRSPVTAAARPTCSSAAPTAPTGRRLPPGPRRLAQGADRRRAPTPAEEATADVPARAPALDVLRAAVAGRRSGARPVWPCGCARRSATCASSRTITGSCRRRASEPPPPGAGWWARTPDRHGRPGPDRVLVRPRGAAAADLRPGRRRRLPPGAALERYDAAFARRLAVAEAARRGEPLLEPVVVRECATCAWWDVPRAARRRRRQPAHRPRRARPHRGRGAPRPRRGHRHHARGGRPRRPAPAATWSASPAAATPSRACGPPPGAPAARGRGALRP